MILFALLSAVIWVVCAYQTVKKHNPFGTTPYLFPLGIYVWGDGLVIGLFWTMLAVVGLWLGTTVFWLGASVYWIVRSAGEVLYWMHEQFASQKRNPPHTLFGHKWVKGEAIWFVYQIVNQCILVCSILAAIYFYRQLT